MFFQKNLKLDREKIPDITKLWPCSDRKPKKVAQVVRTQALFGQ